MGMGWRASPGLMVLCAVVGVVSAVTSIAYPLGFRHIVDGATAHDGTEVTVAVVFVAVTFALGWCLRLVSTLMGSRLTDYCNRYLGERIGGLVNEAPFLDHFEDPELLAEIDGLRDNRRTLAGAPRQVFSLMQLAVQVVGIVVLLALVYPPVLVVPFLAIAPGLASRPASRVQKASDDVLADDRRLLDELFNLASGASSARELRTFGVTGAILERHATLGDRINRQAMRAARRSASLPDGLDTVVGRYIGGRSLSGGQWQRLALARGLMRQAPLLIVLDEPTASLDAPTEAALFSRYREAARRTADINGAITVLVSHRFSTVHMADLIVVLDGGRIAESGNHATLMAGGGLYAELFRLQAQAYLGSL
jgi:ABC-type multidrug transport system fused ATPase/permease subunit